MAASVPKIGGRELIASFPCLQIPKGEEATLEIDVLGWKLQTTLAFDDSGDAVSAVEARPEGAGVRLIFRHWASVLGTAMQSPTEIASLSDGSKLEFMAVNYRIGETNVISLQVLRRMEKTA